MIKVYFALLWLWSTVSTCHAWQGRVVAIADGDTLTVERFADAGQVKIRLYGIDAPERKQPTGEAAKDFVLSVALYQSVQVEKRGEDRYGRLVAVVRLPSGGTCKRPYWNPGWLGCGLGIAGTVPIGNSCKIPRDP